MMDLQAALKISTAAQASGAKPTRISPWVSQAATTQSTSVLTSLTLELETLSRLLKWLKGEAVLQSLLKPDSYQAPLSDYRFTGNVEMGMS